MKTISIAHVDEWPALCGSKKTFGNAINTIKICLIFPGAFQVRLRKPDQ